MKIKHQALTFDDVLLIPGHSTVLPSEADVTTQLTREIKLNIPLLSAAMDTVTESRFAIALAQEGGIGILHKNMDIERQAEEVRIVKKFESGIVKDPVTVTPESTIHDILELRRKLGFSAFPVVDNGALVGIVTNRDVRFVKDPSVKVAELMTPRDKLITVKEGASFEEVTCKLHDNRIEKVLMVDDSGNLIGMMTAKDIHKSETKPRACKDGSGQLRVGAAVGVGGDTEDRVEALIHAGVDVLVVDTAHGHSQKVLDRVKWVRKNFPHAQIIGGNIGTGQAAIDLVKAGADAVKVGMGPGSICTTRVIAGIGMPQITAVANVAEAVKKYKTPIIADGGIRFSGDIGKAIAAGADCVMMGGLFAGTEEAPGEVVLYQGRSYKSYRGMGSEGAMKSGSSDRYFRDDTPQKVVPEGIEGRVPYKGSMVAMVQQLVGGLQATMGYTGCKDIETLKKNGEFVQVTSASLREGHVHDVIITKETPNYSVD